MTKLKFSGDQTQFQYMGRQVEIREKLFIGRVPTYRIYINGKFSGKRDYRPEDLAKQLIDAEEAADRTTRDEGWQRSCEKAQEAQ
jgi:hypothetical protein